jgi:hypothetical protein
MNWVKFGIGSNDANAGNSSGGLAPGGAKSTTSSATAPAAPAVPKPAATPTPASSPAVNTQPPAPQWGPQLGGGMLQNMMGSFGTPQGFGAAAGMMPDLFRGIGRVGGLPALMGIYQMMKSQGGGQGAHDWQILTDPNYKAAAAYGDDQLFALARGLAGSASQQPALPQPPPTPTPVPEAHPYQTIAKNIGMDLARREGLHQGLNRTAKFWGPRLGAQAAMRIPGGKGSFLLDTPVNALDDLADAAGVLPNWAGGKGDTLWFKANRDPEGELQYDENARLQGHYGWNPGAFGNWDMRQFDKDTTPNQEWGFGFGHTNSRAANEGLSYLGSGVNAYSHPLKGLYSAGKFQYHDMNPFRDWEAMADPSLLSHAAYHPVSIPGIVAQNQVLSPHSPAAAFQPGGKHFDSEKQHWAGRYHPVYNPAESNGRPWYASLGL